MKIGCDPEVFLVDAAGAFVSVIDKIGGSKEQPRPLPIGDGFAVQEDNVALEFNIPAAGSPEELQESLKKVKDYLGELVSQQGLKFSTESATLFPIKELMDPRALEFGCDPDFNAWNGGKRNPRPSAPNKQLRSAGGHVHVGHVFGDQAGVIDFARCMDLCLGVPSVLMDSGELRKELYGKAGAFRYKHYGMEYRTLSNFWIFDEKLIDWVWKSTELAMDAWQKNNHNVFKDDGQNILRAIDGNDKDVARYLVGKYNLLIV